MKKKKSFTYFVAYSFADKEGRMGVGNCSITHHDNGKLTMDKILKFQKDVEEKYKCSSVVILSIQRLDK